MWYCNSQRSVHFLKLYSNSAETNSLIIKTCIRPHMPIVMSPFFIYFKVIQLMELNHSPSNCNSLTWLMKWVKVLDAFWTPSEHKLKDQQMVTLCKNLQRGTFLKDKKNRVVSKNGTALTLATIYRAMTSELCRIQSTCENAESTAAILMGKPL